MSAAEFDPKNMLWRTMGRTGLRVPVFSYGGWLTVGGTQKGDIVKDLMKTAYDNGINMFDTAEGYNAGESEREMGRVIEELGWDRRDLIITTKIFFGTNRKSTHNSKGLSRKHIVEGLNVSLKNLRMDYVDVVFAHRPDRTTPMEETVRAFNHVIDQGKAFYWGTSEWSASELLQAHEIARRLNLIGPAVEQPHYSMMHRERFEIEYGPVFKTEGLGTTIWSPLDGGMLTGKYNNGVPHDSRFATNKEIFKDNVKALEAPEGKAKIAKVIELTKVAESIGATMTHLALAWTIKNENVSTCILGATKPEQILDNLKALDVIPKLTPEVMEKIEGILDNKPKGADHYGRYDHAEGKLA